MGESQSPDLRIGDTEREEALRVLGEHMSVGRLSPDEYGDRAARATAAKTRGELTQLFVDLPQPHPDLGGQKAAAVQRRQPPLVRPELVGTLVPLTGLLALALFFTLHTSWVIFLLPAAVAIALGPLTQKR